MALVIYIQPQAPTKPLEGAACNGCGVCCLAQPCPLGMALSRRRNGACAAVHWSPQALRYQCGAVVAPQRVLQNALPRFLGWVSAPLAPLLSRLALRWIAAGAGCDSSLQASPPASTTMDDPSSPLP